MVGALSKKWIAIASFFAFLIHWILASIVVADDIKWYAPVHLNFNIWRPPNATNSSESCGDVVCITEPVYWELKQSDQAAKILVALFSYVSGFNHLCTFFVFYFPTLEPYQSLFWGPETNGPNIFRSVDWGISAPLMIVVNLFLYRVPSDLLALFGYALFTAVTVFSGYLFDAFLAFSANISNGSTKLKQYLGIKAFLVVCLLYLLSWLPLFFIFPYSISDPTSNIFEGLFYNDGTIYKDPNPRDPPPEVYIFIFWLFASFAVFPVVQFFKIIGWQNTKLNDDQRQTLYIKYEFYFIFLSALSKLPLLLLFYGGIKSRQNTALSLEKAGDTKREDYDFTYLAIGLILSVVLGMFEVWIYNYRIKTDTKKSQSQQTSESTEMNSLTTNLM